MGTDAVATRHLLRRRVREGVFRGHRNSLQGLPSWSIREQEEPWYACDVMTRDVLSVSAASPRDLVEPLATEIGGHRSPRKGGGCGHDDDVLTFLSMVPGCQPNCPRT
jgi:hypothetical protein